MGSQPPPGWYADPAIGAPAGRRRYWDGASWTDHVGHRAPVDVTPGRRSAAPVVVGLVVFVLGMLVAVGCVVAALFTANACGPFADGCDDYGQPAPGFEFAVGGALVFAAIGFAALVFAVAAAIVPRFQRSRL